MSNDRIILNLTADDVEEKGFEPAPEGWYHVEIESVETKKSNSAKNPGKPFYSLAYKSVDEDSFKGKFFDNVMLWHGAHFSLVGLAKALGHAKEAGELVVPTEDELVGQELEVFVKIEEYTKKDDSQGKRNAVKRYRAVGGGDAKAATPKAKATKKAYSL